ncbi:MAG: hypothetical protein DMG49_07205 [Acidobacteria bacterium]|nr:MAG: hypothetical protein DMG49_07205 [Acidobacteriota bacterium]
MRENDAFVDALDVSTRGNRGHNRANASAKSWSKKASANGRRKAGDHRRTLEVGASLGRIARQHDVNANQVFYWRKLYREGRLGTNTSTRLLPVRVSAALYSRPW